MAVPRDSSSCLAALDAAGLPTVRRGRLQVLWVALLLLLLALAVYGNSLGNDFVIDDKTVIAGDARVRDCRIGELLTTQYWPGPRGNWLYRPLTQVSFALNWALSHQPWAFRLPNLLLHVLTGLALFLLLRDWTGAAAAGLIAAVVFIVHPIHTGPLNAVVDRAELGVAAFGLLAVWLWWRDGAESAGRGSLRPIWAAAALAASVLFKENALTLAPVVLVLDLLRPGASFCLGRIRPTDAATAGPLHWRRRILRCYLPLALVLFGYLAVRWTVLGAVARPPANIAFVDNPIAHPEHGLQKGDSRLLARWATPLVVLGKAATMLAWPWPLCWDYSYASVPPVTRLGDGRLLVGAAMLALIAAGMLVSYHRRRLVFAALALTLITYSITSNTYVVIGTIFAERYLYLPSVGFCMLIGLLAQAALDSPKTPIHPIARVAAWCFWPILVLLVVIYSWRTVQRNFDWRTNRTLNTADLRTNPRSSRLWCAAAADALNAKDADAAIRHAEQAMRICADYGEPWRLAGLAYWQSGDFDQALRHLTRFFELGGVGDEQAGVAAANIAKSRGDYQAAIGLLTAVVDQNPAAATAHNNLAWYLITAQPVELRDPPAALRHAQAAVAAAPGQGDFLDTYVTILLTLNRREEAVDALQRLLPALTQADDYRAELAKKLIELRRGEEPR